MLSSLLVHEFSDLTDSLMAQLQGRLRLNPFLTTAPHPLLMPLLLMVKYGLHFDSWCYRLVERGWLFLLNAERNLWMV